MIEKITYRLFLVFMVSCAATVVYMVWTQEGEQLGRVIATLFVIGFANFIAWGSLMAYKAVHLLQENKRV